MPQLISGQIFNDDVTGYFSPRLFYSSSPHWLDVILEAFNAEMPSKVILEGF
jgi:hypothetical protein